MALTVETGSIVPGANSYVTLEEARDFATLRGVTLSADDAVLEPLLIKAMDFVEALRARFQGNKVQASQPLQWPRQYVQVDGFDVAEDEIPQTLKDALCQLVIDGAAGNDLSPNLTGRIIKRKKVDVLETEYQDSPNGGEPTPTFTKAMNLLEPLFGSTSSGTFLSVGRA